MLSRKDLERYATGPAHLDLTFVPTGEETRLISAALRAIDQVHSCATMPRDGDGADEPSLAAQFGAARIHAVMVQQFIDGAMTAVEALAEAGLRLSIDREKMTAGPRGGNAGLALRVERLAWAPGNRPESRTGRVEA